MFILYSYCIIFETQMSKALNDRYLLLNLFHTITHTYASVFLFCLFFFLQYFVDRSVVSQGEKGSNIHLGETHICKTRLVKSEARLQVSVLLNQTASKCFIYTTWRMGENIHMEK